MTLLKKLLCLKQTKESQETKGPSQLLSHYEKGSCHLTCNFPKFSSLKPRDVIESEGKSVGHTVWKVAMTLEKKGVVSLSVYGLPANRVIARNDRWSIEAHITVRLQNHNYDTTFKSTLLTTTFDAKEGGHSWSRTFNGISKESGFLKDDTIVFFVGIGITEIKGFNYGGFFTDFSIHRENDSDVILVVDGEKFHVSKKILSLQSPVFRTMFVAEFMEKTRSEVAIRDVDLASFHSFLQMLYMAPVLVSEENVCQLLQLGDRFFVKRVVSECVKFLQKCDMELSELIELAVAFNLDSLLLNKMRSMTLSEMELAFPDPTKLPPTVASLWDKRMLDSG